MEPPIHIHPTGMPTRPIHATMRKWSDFPNGSFFMKKEGTYVQVDSQNFYLTKVVRERYGGPADSYTVTFEGEAVQEDCRKGKPVILKFMYQCVPAYDTAT